VGFGRGAVFQFTGFVSDGILRAKESKSRTSQLAAVGGKTKGMCTLAAVARVERLASESLATVLLASLEAELVSSEALSATY
jgi:hypothetical protein